MAESRGWRLAAAIAFVGVGCTSGQTIVILDAGADGSATDANLAPPAIPPLDPCAALVTCMYEAVPEQAAGAEAAYGAEGACWKTQSPETCRKGCAGALEGLHTLHPSLAACALCKSDSDCLGAAARACDSRAGECVACTTRAHCTPAAPACDVGTRTCAACDDDSDCAGTTPACDVAHHACVQCMTAAQCATGRCEPGKTCCVAKPKQQVCTGYNCRAEDGCGHDVACSCRVGMCDGASGLCSTWGSPCTPGTTDCGNQKCLYDNKNKSYRCGETAAMGPSACTVDSECDKGDPGHTYSFSKCLRPPNSACRRWCLTSADCGNGWTCVADYPTANSITAQTPGRCD